MCFADFLFVLLLLYVNMFCLSSEAGRDLSAREMVVLSNLKVTEEPFLMCQISWKEEDKATFLLAYFSKFKFISKIEVG